MKKPKITIITRDKPNNIRDDIKIIQDLLGNLIEDIEIKASPYDFQSRQEYRPNMWGISKIFMRYFVLNKFGEFSIYHDSSFEIEGALGWYDRNKIVGQVLVSNKRDTYSPEFENDFKAVLLHEILHMLCHHYQIPDNVHDQPFDLKTYVEEVKEKVQKKRTTKILNAIKRFITEFTKSSKEEEVCGKHNCEKPTIKEWALAIKEMEGWIEPGHPDYPNGSLTYRHNNPGALRWSKYQKELKNGFAVFETYEDGMKGLMFQLQIAIDGRSKVYNPEMTLYDFFKVYAPSDDNNDPLKYADFIASKLGVDINFKIKNFNHV